MDQSNPYASPHAPPSPDGAKSRSDDVVGYWQRFIFGFVSMVGVNTLPLAMTWEAWTTCGVERLGWPLTFYSRGGMSGATNLAPEHLFGDFVNAVVAAHYLARATKDGWWALIHRLRTWPRKD